MSNCQCMDRARYPEYWRVCPYALRDSDGSPEGRDAEERLDAQHDSAGRNGIANNQSEQSNV